MTAVSAPARVQQFILGDQAARIAKQVYQHPKGLGFHGQCLSGALQLKLPLMNLHVRESENRALIGPVIDSSLRLTKSFIPIQKSFPVAS